MQKKAIKNIAAIVLLLVVAYNSVYFKKLDEVKAAAVSKEFDAVTYASNYLTVKLTPQLSNAIELQELIQKVHAEPESTFQKYSHALGIGNIKYFLVKGEGVITAIGDDAVSLLLKNDSAQKEIKIATEFVFGNAVRDASGLININEFNNTMDFNNVSAEINKIIRSEVLPPFKSRVKKGDLVQFAGAIELNQAHVSLEEIEVVPVGLKIVKQ
ncbi:MAG: hypothetical protein JWQ40_1536 [Segetibacter sp.]|jgi:predicted lipoprotein|nr:hypothetical protein [Segetibacter sp.]